MFAKPTPKGWHSIEVRPDYNNPRKLKKILDGWFKAGEYKIQVRVLLRLRQSSSCDIN
jgi:hypothetical protein